MNAGFAVVNEMGCGEISVTATATYTGLSVALLLGMPLWSGAKASLVIL